ncbi:LysM peptidoglycan-binding domain-containing protein [Radiobacillus sp. PE A8.2]|uniref:LysM peptidoglycan-binding domain-containing protein n=1 Tax=Radiobacillus sp. PE A8.2 TaxID=3380349 RepID=UPI00389014F0
MRRTSKIIASTVAFGTFFGAMGLTANATTEMVESGETIWEIANENEGITVDEILELNGDVDPYAIPVGTEIQLENENAGNEVTHTVQPENTLFGIASVYDGVTLDEIYEMNDGIDPYNLAIGSEVTVVDRNSNESNSNDTVYHTVQPGNTFYEIASVYDGVTINELKAANPEIDLHVLPVGYELVIPVD